ncbi:aldehyde dehydrogenase family protein [Puia sp.]|jgi:betaine-aldehyde dehydrogenase|uniref:aldehyde dehydrogenase family protein n=1 Tax=Puia sp. TaxID=2045100 RepID=UPI002F3E5DA8
MEILEKAPASKGVTADTQSIAKHWIGGEWIDSQKHGISLNPATGGSLGTYADGGDAEAGRAVDAALTAFRQTGWKSDHALRSKVLLAMADRIETRANDLIQILCAENGKIASEAAMEVDAAPMLLRYWAAKTFTAGRSGEVRPGSFSFTIREAVGVAGIIAPFNAPVALTIRALAPALAAGATTVVKLPGLTAQTNHLICEILSGTPDLPIGVINILTESGSEAAQFLVNSPDVPVISFTGSSKTGRAIMAAGASRLKRLSLELGGKTPMLVFNDADIEAAIFAIGKAVTIFSGQFCMTGSRILVQRAVAERVKQLLAERLEKVRVGPASDPSSELGPMIDKANVLRVNGVVEEAIASGAKVIVRGGPATEGILGKGAFYRPTLLEVTNPDLPVVQQEVFGPVATLQVFDTEAEAIALANYSDYGLAAGIWTRDVDRPWRVAKALQAGTIWINTYAQVFPEFEEGGYKQSGIGRLNGEAAMEAFLEYKHITFNPGIK